MERATPRTLRDFVLGYAARRGWRTQRHVAVAFGIVESGLSRFLNGELEMGARRTHALFQMIGVPVDEYDLAYRLVGEAQERARSSRLARLGRSVATRPAHRPEPGSNAVTFRTAGTITLGVPAYSNKMTTDYVALLPPTMPERPVRYLGAPGEEMPVSIAAHLFVEESLTGAQIAAFFDDGLAG